MKSEPKIKKIGVKSKPLKNSNGFSNMTNGHSGRSRAARASSRTTESHKLTEYFKEELKSPKTERPESPKEVEKTVKVENKITNGNSNHKLTEYFPVRRSVRKTSKCVMAEKMRDLERAVREQREDGLAVSFSNNSSTKFKKIMSLKVLPEKLLLYLLFNYSQTRLHCIECICIVCLISIKMEQ